MGNQANKQRNFSQIQPFRDVMGRQKHIFAAIVLKFLRKCGYYIGKSPSKILKRFELVAMGNQAKYSVIRGKFQLFMGRLGLPEAYICSYRLEIFREHGYDIS